MQRPRYGEQANDAERLFKWVTRKSPAAMPLPLPVAPSADSADIRIRLSGDSFADQQRRVFRAICWRSTR